ncbi:hypothetical protein HN903_00220 [archaeon]|jgi:hypothetical protein|nr:hypothetical protein [archaeon]
MNMIGSGMKKYGVLALVFILLIGVGGFFYFDVSFLGDEKSFDVNNALLKVVVAEGKNASKLLGVTSYGYNDFRVESDLDFIRIGEAMFSLGEGEERDVEVLFDSEGLEAGVYFGKLVLSSGEEFEVPIIMEVESEEILFDGNINVPLEYVNVYSGKSLVVENKLFNLENIGLENIEVTYFVRSLDGKVLFSDEENIAVESQLLNTKVVAIPKDAEAGDYVFSSVVKYKDSVGTSSYFFEVRGKMFYDIEGDFFMFGIVIALIGLIFFIVYYTKRRDDVLMELQRDYRREVNKNVDVVIKKEGRVKTKGGEKGTVLKEIRAKHRAKIMAIRKIYRARLKVVKGLRKAKKESEVSRKLKEWKKQGYNIEEISGLGVKKNLKESVKGHRKEGYNL